MTSNRIIHWASDIKSINSINEDIRQGTYVRYNRRGTLQRVVSFRKRSGQLQACRLSDGAWLNVN